jgi:hypothetical protein
VTFPGGGAMPMGGSRPPFEDEAARVLAAARRATVPQRPVLTQREKTEAQEAARQQRHCALCGGIHAMPSTAACPRLASFELDGDGKVRAGTFWPGKRWSKGRVLLAEDAHEDGEEEDAAGDG